MPRDGALCPISIPACAGPLYAMRASSSRELASGYLCAEASAWFPLGVGMGVLRSGIRGAECGEGLFRVRRPEGTQPDCRMLLLCAASSCSSVSEF